MSNRSQSAMEQRMIDEVIDNFDFEKCHRAMRLLDWQWFGIGVPTIARLKESSIERLQSAIKGVKSNGLSMSDSYFSSSGGLKGTAWKNRFGHVAGIKLEFVLTDWDADGDR